MASSPDADCVYIHSYEVVSVGASSAITVCIVEGGGVCEGIPPGDMQC